ncbi:MAG: CCA tRNA nucleotidyltransferase [Candidatus Aminicenantes bacterium]|nr:MAG: CCA tRNA nucleotidyltransferase [Candidatus Aminicenantes bacterium]
MTPPAFDFPDRALFVRLFGADVYAVGGFVRDLILGRPSTEIDLLVARHPLDEIVRKLEKHGRVDLVGKSFGIIKFGRQGRTYDIALPRTDRAGAEGTRGHKDIVVAADPGLPVEKDLERRDFRTNSMALRLKDGTIIDPFEGRKDTLAKRIRLTNPAAFPDDPLRVLRVARFASVLGFKVDPAIYPSARAVSLAGLSVERVNDEMFRVLLDSPRPSIGLEEMFRLGVLEQWFPELQALALVIQDSVFHPEQDAFGHHTVWAHTKLSVDQAAALGRASGLPTPKRLALLLAALYHDLGKTTTTRWEYKRGRMAVTSCGHDIQSERAARRILARFKAQTWNGYAIGRMVPLLIRTHHRAGELWTHRDDVTKKAFNRLAADVQGEIDLVVLLDAADRAGRGARLLRGLDKQARWLFKKFDELKVNRETIKPLVMGRDLIKLGVQPGPEMGRILKKLYKAQLDNGFETKAAGLERARRLVERTTP